MEIERKFLVKYLPDDFSDYPCIEITQGYICTDPVLRIRQAGNLYFLALKGSGLVIREELELEISKKEFDKLSEKLDTHFISKTRYLIPLRHGKCAELDIYKNLLSGLFVVEVEFENTDEADKFKIPDWFGTEVSKDPSYKNSCLAKYGKPRQ